MSHLQKLENPSSHHPIKENKVAVNVKSKRSSVKKPSVIRGDCGKRDIYKESDILDSNTSIDVHDKGSVTDLSSPGLCSALQLANEIQAASLGPTKVEELNLFQKKQLDDAVKQKAMKKANVPFTKHIFKDLIDLNICDEKIASGKTHPKNINFNSNKDPVFRLEDFYKPDFSTEASVKFPDQKFEIEKIDYYNGFELYERLQSLKNLVK